MKQSGEGSLERLGLLEGSTPGSASGLGLFTSSSPTRQYPHGGAPSRKLSLLLGPPICRRWRAV